MLGVCLTLSFARALYLFHYLLSIAMVVAAAAAAALSPLRALSLFHYQFSIAVVASGWWRVVAAASLVHSHSLFFLPRDASSYSIVVEDHRRVLVVFALLSSSSLRCRCHGFVMLRLVVVVSSRCRVVS